MYKIHDYVHGTFCMIGLKRVALSMAYKNQLQKIIIIIMNYISELLTNCLKQLITRLAFNVKEAFSYVTRYYFFLLKIDNILYTYRQVLLYSLLI